MEISSHYTKSVMVGTIKMLPCGTYVLNLAIIDKHGARHELSLFSDSAEDLIIHQCVANYPLYDVEPRLMTPLSVVGGAKRRNT